MKIDFIIISSILVILSFLPFILFPIFQRKEQKKFRKVFKEETAKLGLNISYELSWNNNIAGIDVLKKQLLLLQQPDSQYMVQTIDLSKINRINTKTQSLSIKQQNKLTLILSRVDLEFYENYSESPLVLNLFDYNLGYSQDYEIKNAKKLVSELQKYISFEPVLKHIA